MKKKIIFYLAFFAFLWADAHQVTSAPDNNSISNVRNLHLLIVIDGLRPDYITPEYMPNLYALGHRGVIGEKHSAVFPTYTRANAPSISTGNYPVAHGVLHNHMWMAEMLEDSFSTGLAENLIAVDAETGGQLFTTPTVGEIMEHAGLRYFVASSSSTGAAYLLNHQGSGLGLWNTRGLFIPETERDEAFQAVGKPPTDNPGWTKWVFNSTFARLLSDTPPDFTVMWIGETDAAGHTHGVGAPETMEAVAHVDRHIGRLVRTLEEEDLSDRVNIFVTTDHGFSTTTGGFNLSEILAESGIDSDVRIVSNMIYQENADFDHILEITEVLQRHEAIGAMYSPPLRPVSSEGIPGTISTAAIHWNHERSPHLLISPAWFNDVNEFGYPGSTTFGGTATHGSDSPFDIRIYLLAAGPDIKQDGLRSGNVDFIPTALHLMGIDPPESMNGRVLYELLEGEPDRETIRVHEHEHRAAVTFTDGFRYETRVEVLNVGSTTYMRGAETRRIQKNPR